jgi:hypothetical protein
MSPWWRWPFPEFATAGTWPHRCEGRRAPRMSNRLTRRDPRPSLQRSEHHATVARPSSPASSLRRRRAGRGHCPAFRHRHRHRRRRCRRSWVGVECARRCCRHRSRRRRAAERHARQSEAMRRRRPAAAWPARPARPRTCARGGRAPPYSYLPLNCAQKKEL